MTNLKTALAAYLARQDGKEAPDGEWESDSWQPSPAERCPCCDSISGKSILEDGMLRHCKSMKHVAALHGVDIKALRSMARKIRLESGQYFFAMAGPYPRGGLGICGLPIVLGERVSTVATSVRIFSSARRARLLGSSGTTILRVAADGIRRCQAGGGYVADAITPMEIIGKR